MEEILRFQNVTYEENKEPLLEGFHLSIYRGEIMGLIAERGRSTEGILKLLERNLPLQEGYIYLKEEMINSWKESDGSYNKITIIQRTGSLVEGMKVYENIFILPQNKSKKPISISHLKEYLLAYFAEIGVMIKPEAYVEKLTYFERIVVELIRGIILESSCIVLVKVDALLNEKEREDIFCIMEYYSKKGYSFLYVSSYMEEIPSLCHRWSMLSEGKACMIWDKKQESFFRGLLEIKESKEEKTTLGEQMEICFQMWKQQKNPSFFSLKIKERECVIMQSNNHSIFMQMIDTLMMKSTLGKWEVRFLEKKEKRIKKPQLAVIAENAAKNMIFEELSVIDNLKIGGMDRVKAGIDERRFRGSIEKEGIISENILGKKTEELNFQERIEVVYGRTILMKPSVVFIIQPFSGINYIQRKFLVERIKGLTKRKIGVVVLTINFTDTGEIGDRFIKIDKEAKMVELNKEEFIKIQKK